MLAEGMGPKIEHPALPRAGATAWRREHRAQRALPRAPVGTIAGRGAGQRATRSTAPGGGAPGLEPAPETMTS